jgi:uncharacterized protein involved in outer membrane biogenesis
MRRYKKIFIGLAVFIVLVGITGVFILPPIIKPILIEKLSETLHREAAIEKITINPFTLSATLKVFTLKERNASSPFVSFEELHVNAEGLYSLIKGALILKDIRLTRPYVNLSRHKDGTYNFSDLIPKEEAKAEEKKPFHFSLNNIRIIDGSIDFDDGPMKTRHTVRGMNLSIPFISNVEYYRNDYIEPRFSAVINGDPYEIAGRTKPFLESRETIFDVDTRDLDIPYYLNYIPVKLNCRLTSASLDTKMNISFIQHKGKPPLIKLAGTVALNKVVLDDMKKRTILRIPSLNIALASVEPLVPMIHLSRISMQSPVIVIRRSKEGDLNIPNLLAQEKKGKPEKKAKPPSKPEKKNELTARIDYITVESASVTFADEAPAEPVNIRVAPLNLKVVNLSTEKGTSGNVDLSLTVDKSGRVSVRGPLDINPFRADLAFDVKNLGIRTLQPYFTDKVKINVTRGALSTAGRFTMVRDSEGKSRMKYTGKMAVSNLATIDKAFSNDFVNWKQLYFNGIDAGVNPFFVNIKGISLADFYARIIVHPDGSLNIKNIFGGKEKEGEKAAVKETASAKPVEKTAETEKPDDTARSVKIGKVTLQGGTIDFTDRFIKPNYSARMLNIGGSVTGLSSEQISRATIDLRGNLGYGSPIEIKGQINPLIKDIYADMKLRFKDIELSPVTPYSSRYVGYPILKGKLTFDIAYLIEQRKLDAQNKVFIDQLTFGERMESPDAIKAPVTLAVSLLTDRNGQINLDIPVSGSLGDPQFRLWPIIWQVIVNLITKAVTAPFALLSSLLGGGEEMSYVEFDYGSDLVSQAGQQKIKSLVKALYERPNIKMDIEGYVDVEEDKEGLKQAAFQRKIKAQKLNDMIRKGEPAVPVNQVQIQPQEYEKYLMLAYQTEKFPKPRNIIGMAKSLPPQEMKKLMLAYIAVTDSDLRLLASRRAENVKGFILKSGQVQPGRVFIVQPQSLSPPTKEKAKDSRADFRLK